MGETSRFGFTTIESTSQKLSDNSYKYPHGDRNLLDLLVQRAVELHRHTGEAASTLNPTAAPDLVASTSGGSIPGATRVYYRYTLLDAEGFESAASPESYVDTAAVVATPNAATLEVATTGGTLPAGMYQYQLSAYTTGINEETLPSTPISILVPVGTTTNEITLTLPSVPAGASGFNIYRKKPGGGMVFLAQVASGPATYIDNGSVTEDVNRLIPRANTTAGTNSVTVTLPSPAPDGFTWKLYRTYNSGNYDRSLLIHEVTPGEDQHIDIGLIPDLGKFPSVSQFVGQPPKIDLLYHTSGREYLFGRGLLADMPDIDEAIDGAYYLAVDDQGGTLYQADFNLATPQWIQAAAGVAHTHTTRILVGPFVLNDVDPAQVNVALDLLGSVVDAATPTEAFRTGVPMVRAGSVTGIVVRSSQARAGGSLTCEATVAGAGTGLTAVLDGSNTTFKATTQAAAVDAFVAGDLIGVRFTATTDWAPGTADVTVMVEVTVVSDIAS